MTRQPEKDTAIYTRLSRDDELQGDSNSIIHQYNRFVNCIFGIPRKDQWGTVIRRTQTPIPFDTFAKYLGKQASNSQWSQLHQEQFRLSIYLYDIGSWDHRKRGIGYMKSLRRWLFSYFEK